MVDLSCRSGEVQLLSQSDGLVFDGLALLENGLAASGIDAFRSQVIQALMIPPGVVMADEVRDLPFKIARQVIVFK